MRGRAYFASEFEYPGFWQGNGLVEVSVYVDGLGGCMVLLHDHDQHENTSVTNAIETVCHKVKTEVVETLELPTVGGFIRPRAENTLWVHFSEADKMYSKVGFHDRVQFVAPNWRYIAQPWLDELSSQYGVEPGLQQKPVMLEERA
ncbi:hypothetical protein [uncultured Meiothermus sp.]|jgi:hypothetical protein|uniref:hypothetical protein n=1 Tax=uncultured Meiothermus sp. TaxID=157471 RepID=UPI002603EC7E|nr:hypothetical protein [uncultured Meiothermus sp.]